MAKVQVVGNAGSDCELKFIQGSRGDFAVANFSLAETPREKKGDEWVEGETIWWKVSATGSLAETLVDFVIKGKKYVVEGDLKPFEYTNKAGEKKSGFEIRAKMVGEIGTLKRKSQKESPSDEWGF